MKHEYKSRFAGSKFNFPRVRQTFGFTFLFFGWTCRGTAVFWRLLLSLFLGSVFVVVIVLICVWSYRDGNILTGPVASPPSVDLCAPGHTFLLLWNTFDFLFWLLLFSLFCLVFFSLLFLHLLSICYKTAARQCGQIRVLVKQNDFCETASLWTPSLSSFEVSSLFLVFVFLGLASFPFLPSAVPFVSSFFFFGFCT